MTQYACEANETHIRICATYYSQEDKTMATATTTIRLAVDMRETTLIECLRKLLPSDGEEETEAFQVLPLEIGDALVQFSGDETTPAFSIIIERKTEQDLLASIRDGRYREQKVRMVATTAPHYCLYIVENPYHARSIMDNKAYSGAVLHTMFRDRMHVVIAQNIETTAAWIVAIFEKCKKHPDKMYSQTAQIDGGAEGQSEQEYISHVKIKTRKLQNIDTRTCFLLQLGQLPGISEKLAVNIASTYPSWRALLSALDACASKMERIRMLCNVPLLGAKKAAKILEYLTCSD